MKAARLGAGLEVELGSIEYSSGGDICHIHFTEEGDAVETANLAAEMIRDAALLRKAIPVARENGYES